MFSSFFGYANRTKPTIHMQQACQKHSLSNMLQLPNGFVLRAGSDEEENPIHLELYDPIKKIKVATCHLESTGFSRFVCMSREWVLTKCGDGKLYVVNSSTLERNKELENILAAQKFDFRSGIYLGEQQFVTLNRKDSCTNTANIKAHNLSKMEFNQSVSTICCPRILLSYKDLFNGLFADKTYGDGSSYYQVRLFKREQGSAIRFIQIGTLKPKMEDAGFGPASGDFVGLPDGKILTYHESGNHFQVWQDNGKCLNEWSWHKDIKCDDGIFKQGFLTCDVAPFPDGEHLLILAFTHLPDCIYKLFLFNMKTRMMKSVDFSLFSGFGLTQYSMGMTMLTNGQVAVRMSHLRQGMCVVCIDFTEMMDYRQGTTQLLSSAGLTPDVNNLVTSYISDTSPWKIEEAKNPGKR